MGNTDSLRAENTEKNHISLMRRKGAPMRASGRKHHHLSGL